MKINYKLFLAFVIVFVTAVFIVNLPTKAYEINKESNQASTYSAKGLSWYLIAGQKKYTTSFYVEAGGSIIIGVLPSVSSAKYSVGILQPSGSERKITKSGNSTTTYAISSSGYYKVFIHNANSTAVDYTISYAY